MNYLDETSHTAGLTNSQLILTAAACYLASFGDEAQEKGAQATSAPSFLIGHHGWIEVGVSPETEPLCPPAECAFSGCLFQKKKKKKRPAVGIRFFDFE